MSYSKVLDKFMFKGRHSFGYFDGKMFLLLTKVEILKEQFPHFMFSLFLSYRLLPINCQ